MASDVTTPSTYALSYLDMGLSVFPLAPREKKPPKHFKWEQLQDALPTEAQVKIWFDRTDNNVAIVTGKVSRLLALDIDGDTAKLYTEHVIDNKIRLDTKEAINKTLWTQTGGGGYHILIRYNPEELDKDDSAAGEIKNAILWHGHDNHSEIRLKSDGSYVVFPPSIHPSGNSYKFVKGNDITQFSKAQLLDLVRALRQFNASRAKIHDATDELADDAPPAPTLDLDEEQVMDAVVILKPHYIKGWRHEFVLYLSGWLRKEGIKLESAKKLIQELAENDEELPSRLATLNATYQKDNLDEIQRVLRSS